MDCPECQRLKRENAELAAKVIQMAQRWIDLKRFIIDKDEEAVEVFRVGHGCASRLGQ